MKKMSIRNLCICMSVNLALWIIAVIVFKTVPSPTMEYCMASIMILMVVCFAVTMLYDPPDPQIDVRTLVIRSMMAHLDKPRQISEKTFLGSREPKGYVHVFVTDTDKSFQLFFSTASNLREVRRAARAAIISLGQCYVAGKIKSCGTEGFVAISEVNDESYKVFVYRNPVTRHFRVYVCVESMERMEVG